MSLQLLGFRKHALQESVGLNLLERVVNFYGGATANDPMDVLAVTAKTVTMREKTQSVLPTNKFSTHWKNRTVRVHRAFFV